MSDTPSQPAASKYRKKPVVIEAIQWTGLERDLEHVLPFFVDFSALPNNGATIQPGIGYTPPSGELTIPTLEGDMTASPGDFIIRGVKGEYYPCKPEIFAMTYKPAVVAPTQPASDYCKCEHTLFVHPDGGKCNGITPITHFSVACSCKQFVSEPAVVSPDATADDDITALALSYIEMENTPPTRAQYNRVMSELFKTSGECGDLRNELAALKAEKPSPDYTALIEQFESLAWLHHKDAKNSGSHWDLECRMCDIIKQMRATLEAVSAPAPVSNTLRERIAYALGDVSARCHVELGRNPLMLELADAVLALLDKKEVK